MADSENLHGNAPDKSSVALLLIDVISDFDFPDGDELLKNTLPVVRNIAALRKKAKEAKIPVVYVNDNFGKWQSDFRKLLENSLKKSAKGAEIAKILKPEKDDYFVLKPKHSGFYSTTLEILLEHLETETLILTGVATDLCILFTANDAYMRGYKLFIPEDCVASVDKKENERALKYLEKNLQADIRASEKINLEKLLKK